MQRNADDILDELLVVRAQDSDLAAMQLLVRRWHSRLLRHAIKMTQREDVAADVVQESWLAICRGLTALKDPATFRSWVYRIVHNKSVDWVRKEMLQRKVERDRKQEMATANEPAVSEGIDDLQQAIASLPPEEQVLLRMYYRDEMPLKEISSILDVPVGTLKYRLFELRQQLKTIIEGK